MLSFGKSKKYYMLLCAIIVLTVPTFFFAKGVIYANAASTTTLVSDSILGKNTFQRSNQSFWGKASDGQTWGGDANSQSIFSIVNNAGQVRNGSTSYTLTVENPDPSLNDEVVKLQGVFAYSYPKLVERFGSSTAAKHVTLTIDPNGTGVAGTDAANAHIVVNAKYMQQHPDDLAWLTHELVHVVQNYSGNNVPGWFTEGMADYGRYYYAPPGSNPSWWTLPGNPSSTDSYTAGYGVAARFLIWLQQNTSPTIVDQLNHAGQMQKSFSMTFQQIIGETVDQLWEQYKANPAIS